MLSLEERFWRINVTLPLYDEVIITYKKPCEDFYLQNKSGCYEKYETLFSQRKPNCVYTADPFTFKTIPKHDVNNLMNEHLLRTPCALY